MSDILDAVEAGDTPQVASYLDGDPSLVEFQPFGETPLTIAVQQGKKEVVKLLLERGANVNHHGNNGRTPLHFASVRGKYDLANSLLKCSGIDLEATDDFGHTPLLAAAKMGEAEVAELLLQNGANFDVASAVCLGNVQRVRDIISADPNAISRSPHKDDLLTDAVSSHNYELVKLLLSQPGVDPKTVGSSGEPPLVAAVSRSDYSPDIVKELMAHGADPAQRSSSGNTALSRAHSLGLPNPKSIFQ